MDEILIYGLTLLSACLMIFWKLTDPRKYSDKIKAYFSYKVIYIGIFTFFYFGLNFYSGMYFPLPKSEIDQALSYFGVTIFFLGFSLSVWAKLTMGKSWGMPASHDRLRQKKLITKGPFMYSRNPIYIGLIMVLAGYGLALQSIFTFLVLIPVYYFFVSAKKEEKLLEKKFKNEYMKYKKEVPRFF